MKQNKKGKQILESAQYGLEIIFNTYHSYLNRKTQRWVTLVGKHGTFHLYDENFPSMFIPLWLTTVDGA